MRYYLMVISDDDLLGNKYYRTLECQEGITDDELEDVMDVTLENYPVNSEVDDMIELPLNEYNVLSKYM